MIRVTVHDADAKWEENKHPRNSQGQFAEKGTSAPLKIEHMQKVGEQIGSNPGGVYTHINGNKYYVKHLPTPEHAKNELLASKLYEAAGAPVPPHTLVDEGEGKLGVAKLWMSGVESIKPTDPAHLEKAQRHFATHAWLANWDAVGASYDNQATLHGLMHTLDVGGALLYRAQGSPKGEKFGTASPEFDTLRDPNTNPKSAKIFGNMTTAQLRESAVNVALVPNDKIRMLAMVYGPGSESDREALANKLIARKYDLINSVMSTT